MVSDGRDRIVVLQKIHSNLHFYLKYKFTQRKFIENQKQFSLVVLNGGSFFKFYFVILKWNLSCPT